ncbi:MAG TPA: hypothetical protein VLJ37_04975 [bacterium]|nr:hypothetical protein [bacterium]
MKNSGCLVVLAALVFASGCSFEKKAPPPPQLAVPQPAAPAPQPPAAQPEAPMPPETAPEAPATRPSEAESGY